MVGKQQIEYSRNNELPLPRLGYKKTIISLLGVTCSPSLTCLVCGKLAVILWAALWSDLRDKELRDTLDQQPNRNWGFLSSAPKELNPAKSHMNDSEADLPPVKLSDETTAPKTAYLQPPKRPWTTGTQISCTQISNPQKLR